MKRLNNVHVARFMAYGLVSAALAAACGGDENNGDGAGGGDGGPAAGTGGVSTGATGGTGAQGGSPTSGGSGGIVGTGGVATGASGGTGGIEPPDASAGTGNLGGFTFDGGTDGNMEAGEAGPPCPGELVDVTAEGDAVATNSWSPSTAALAVDADATTSWWVADSFTSETFTWTLPADECIGRITITNTAADTTSPNSGSWAGWDFQQVIIRVLDADGTELDERIVTLSGTSVTENYQQVPISGSVVELEFSGFTNAYAGFSELTVEAVREPEPVPDGGPGPKPPGAP